MPKISEERLKKLEELEKLLGSGNVKIIIESDKDRYDEDDYEPRPKMRDERREDPRDQLRQPKKQKKPQKLFYNNSLDATVLTPVFVIGILAGVLTGIPLVGLLFIILLPLVGVLLMKAFAYFLSMRIGAKKAFFSCILAGGLAALISTTILFVLEIFLAGYVYDTLYSFFSFMDPVMINTLLGITGFDKTLSLMGLFARFVITLVLFPILLFLGAYINIRFSK
ncbi:hypothetical protein KO465_06565 [Candidatus Micrarchaeota archaeon]|jgi:hypothetical protein|nr:hypothetical protein [Candidatus Micrarchaeota archaeon]